MADKLSFQNILDHLLDSKKDIPQSHLQYYSDLDPKSLRLFMDVWSSVKPERKLRLLDALLVHFDSETIVSYEEIGRALLTDPDAEVRARAIRLLAETDDPRLTDSFVSILLNDAELAPRMEAATLLGEFVLLAELEKLDGALQRKIEKALVTVVRSESEDSSLRKLALEGLGYSSNIELMGLIESAYERADPTWVASALRAMGRSHDDERWREDVISRLLDEDPRIRLAAVESAGELLIEEAGPIVLKMLEDEEEDDDVTAAALWTLSQIGGEDARIYLVNLIENTEDEVALEYLGDALENLNFNEELNKFDLLDLDDDDLDKLDDEGE
jgi:HEAT repeat protein